MKVIAEGIYHRGSLHGTRDEMPRHEIHLKPFAIDTHPITNEQFARFLEAMGGEKDGNNNDMIRLRDFPHQAICGESDDRVGLLQASRRWSLVVWSGSLC